MIYEFRHPKTGEIKQLIQGMNDVHKYIDNSGLEWERVWNKGYASFDSKIDPNKPSDFVRYTKNRAGTYGDLQDLSKELSQKREDKLGHLDPVKENHWKKYSKDRGNRKHLNQKKYEVKQALKGNKHFEFVD